jgi:hypothetical protein
MDSNYLMNQLGAGDQLLREKKNKKKRQYQNNLSNTQKMQKKLYLQKVFSRFVTIIVVTVLLELLVAGDAHIDVGYDKKQATTRLLKVWTAWKEHSHFRYSLIRSRAAIFDMWRDAKQCTVETVLKVKAAADMCDSNARRSPTLLELAHETDFVDRENIELVLGDESLFVPPSREVGVAWTALCSEAADTLLSV